MIDQTLHSLRKLVPAPVFRFIQPKYHWTMALMGAARYGFPSR